MNLDSVAKCAVALLLVGCGAPQTPVDAGSFPALGAGGGGGAITGGGTAGSGAGGGASGGGASGGGTGGGLAGGGGLTGGGLTGGGAGQGGGNASDAGVECFAGTDDDLPDQVFFRSKTQSFNRQWYVALHDGLIYVKPNTEAGRPAGSWALLGTGVPAGGGLTHFTAPDEVSEISADGTWLHAISPAGVFYRGTDFTQNVSTLVWSDSWGHPAATGAGMVTEFPTTYGWSVSDSQRAGVDRYEDRLGTTHNVGNGVAHVYRLGANGRTLHFNDWWLPNDWSRQICMPGRGTFFAENLSSSASTTFLIGTDGAMYTRLYDYDTSGENDTLTYSFALTAASGDTRALPAEDWRRQPDVTDGLITRTITIFQDGQGNAARVLRVEGVKQGRTGFFFKRINDASWSFQETGRKVCGPFLNASGRAAPPVVAPADFALAGTLSGTRQGSPVSVELRLSNFNIQCSPAEARLFVGGRAVTVNGAPLTLSFQHVHSMTLSHRPTDYWDQGQSAVLRAAIVLPSTLTQIDDAAARQKVLSLVGSRKVINFKGSATKSRLSLVEMTWLDPLIGVVPGNEKANPGDELRLEATP
ncbi:MAG: hypothetical protein U0228_22945 [Myxococcaceae bacterium]